MTNELPSTPGTYALLLVSRADALIEVGRLGTFRVQAGFYAYVGSAMGPGGLAARVGRHLRLEKRLHWHVDFLRAVTQFDEVWYVEGTCCDECRWAEALDTMRGSRVPLVGFGASDCGCPSHLFFFASRPSLAAFDRRLGKPGLHRVRVEEGE